MNKNCFIDFQSTPMNKIGPLVNIVVTIIKEMDLLKKLLEKHPSKRITVDEALDHPFINKTPKTTILNRTEETEVNNKISNNMEKSCESFSSGEINEGRRVSITKL